jgi:Mg2+-importing ATPase
MAGWWQQPVAELLLALQSSSAGLGTSQAQTRLAQAGPNVWGLGREWPVVARFLARLANPLVAVLLVASLVSALMGDRASFAFVAVVVLLSISLDFAQEHRAGRAAQALQRRVALQCRVWRDGSLVDVPAHQLVPGDVVQLAAGSLVPADGRLLQAKDFFVNASQLTGEAFPVEKFSQDRPVAFADGGRSPDSGWDSPAVVCAGSSVVSGAAQLLVCATGDDTAMGRMVHSLAEPPPPTAFERGMRQFGTLLTWLTVALVLFVMLVNVLAQRPLLDAFMFAVALAVGLTPELLPMIVSVTLARGALRLSAQEVIVKRLSAVQDLGAMDVLCTDKTGTLTEARIELARHVDAAGADSDAVLTLARLNSQFETGLKSPLDDAILAHDMSATALLGLQAWHKLDEVPFDFERRRVSVLVQRGEEGLLVVKGAPEDIIRLCARQTGAQGDTALDAPAQQALSARVDAYGQQGMRVLAVAQKQWPLAGPPTVAHVSRGDEAELVFVGLLAFMDPPKLSARQALRDLQAIGVQVCIVTGDSEAVTRHVAGALGLPVKGVLTGAQLVLLDDPALRAAVARANLFCRVNPEQKNRVVRAFKARGHVVGYLGDGINDAPPLHSADVGISVQDAVDVAKQAADLVLTAPDLRVLRQGVMEGRRTFVNVMKYIMMASSSNFGNMLSMAAAALFVPFLPMLPVQILLNNFLYDLSEVAIPMDQVDTAELRRPKRWNVHFIRAFMLAFGTLSSLFDFCTFAALIWVLQAAAPQFQTAWFVESMATQVLVVFVIRTRDLPWRSRPSPWLVLSAAAVLTVAVALPSSALGRQFGFVALPPGWLATMLFLTALYLVAAQVLKQVFYRRLRGHLHPRG